MGTLCKVLLRLLEALAHDACLSSEQREKAMYIGLSFLSHKNTCRLMAQVSRLMKGEVFISPYYRVIGASKHKNTLTHRHGKYLQAVMTEFRIAPTIADFEGHPIELVSILDLAVENSLPGEKRYQLHKDLLSMEKKANEDLIQCTEDYGYHYIFRAGLQEYYMTKTVVENVNFWRPDPRGNGYRVHIQKLCYETMETRLRLNDAEKRALIQATDCNVEDAYNFCKYPDIVAVEPLTIY
ncbi:hypothetical protein ABOM_005232 [Aspergillus bombycis]|uniref:Mating locus protein n=1 Tax=Aspergillus bombycis TaxID=109264 RepID=A0A1F8A3U5_9EURO|nr:hypothetical protein ABOM_005232 [Aspergillus bombycis]OGM45988.1 hypothetical protein ABOM_005232 [Aspergillus bombycis]